MNHGPKGATGVTVLWALRSPCNLNCQYCYFGTLEESRQRQAHRRMGELTHAPDNDAPVGSVMSFISSFNPGLVKRVFIAGGEPLQWQPVFDIIRKLKTKGCEVVVCTNGLALANAATSNRLIEAQVDAISVSLDSSEADYNDALRRDPRGVGFRGVVAGIRQIINCRNASRAVTKVGIYTVVTRENINDIPKTAEFIAELGGDYFIYQPLSLAPDHTLYKRLSLRGLDQPQIGILLNRVANLRLRLTLPNKHYLKILPASIADKKWSVSSCFGGRELFFIQPDGTVWDCPSCHKIAIDAPTNTISILTRGCPELS